MVAESQGGKRATRGSAGWDPGALRIGGHRLNSRLEQKMLVLWGEPKNAFLGDPKTRSHHFY